MGRFLKNDNQTPATRKNNDKNLQFQCYAYKQLATVKYEPQTSQNIQKILIIMKKKLLSTKFIKEKKPATCSFIKFLEFLVIKIILYKNLQKELYYK